jgi:TP901 family phage tail tape measure protein
MGERSINTILRLKNEAEYRSALKGCNQELKNLKSELDLTSSEFRNNANSIDALRKKQEVLSKTYDAQQNKISALRGALEHSQQTREKEKQTVADLKAQYEKAKQTLASYGDEVDKNSEEYQQAKTEVDKLTNAIYTHQTKLDAAEKSVNYYSTQLNKATIELHALEDKQAANNKLLEEAEKSADGCATSIDRYGDAVKQAADGTEKSISAVEALSSAMVASGIQEQVEEVAAAMMECAEASAAYELAIAKVYTLADESVVSKEAMRSGIMEIAFDMRKGAEEIGDAVYEALSAGVDTANVLSFVRQSTQLSVAGFTDAANSVDVLTTILNAYGLEADQTEAIASKLVKTQDLGKITVDDLGKVLGRVIPSAAAYGVNLDNVATAYANMTASGINAENTTTYLSTMLDELADSGSAVSGVLKEQTGKSFAELMASGNSLGDVLAILGDSVDDDAVKFSGLWSSATAGKAALALFNTGAERFNSTLNAMANSSGAVAANYAKMADTSDAATRRMNVAAQNLKIAVGDKLNPVLDELRNAGADIMEMAARVVSNNPALVSAIVGVVTALGLLAGGLSALMIVKSVTAAMAALNITLAANPAGLIAVAVAGLAAALVTLAANTETTAEKVDALTESSQKLSESVAANGKAYDDSVISITAAYETVGSYIDRLAELETQGVKTDEQQAEYALLLEKIQAVIPDINIAIDEQTGLLKGGADALRDHAEQWKKTAMQEAAYARYKDDIQAMADAEYELQKNTKLREGAQKRAEIAQELLNDAVEKAEAVSVQYYNAVRREGESVEEFQARESALRQELETNTEVVAVLRRELSEATSDFEIYDAAVKQSEKAIAANTEQVDAATAAIAGFEEQVVQTSGAVQEGVGESSDAAAESLQKLSDEYNSLRDAAIDSLDTQFGLFEEVKLKCDQSTSDMIRALESQKNAFNNYAANIKKAVAMGIDDGLILKLSDGSTQSMAILDAIVNDANLSVDELNAAFAGTEEAKGYLAGTLEGMKEDLNSFTDDAKNNAYTAGYGLGQNLGEGAVAGLKSKESDYRSAAKSFSNAGFYAAKVEDQVFSPSRRWRWLGEMDAEGVLVAHKQAIPKIERSSVDLTNSGYAAAIRARQRQMSSTARAASQAPSGGVGSELLPVMREILTAVREGKVIAVDGRRWVGATLQQYDAQMGQQQILVERGAK